VSGVSIEVRASGLDGVISRYKRMGGSITAALGAELDLAMAQAKITVQAGTPVRTGAAQAGWRVERVTALERRLSNPVVYVPFLVLGTRYMNPSVVLDAALEMARAGVDRSLAGTGARIVSALDRGGL